MKINTKILPRTSREKSFVQVKFSMCAPKRQPLLCEGMGKQRRICNITSTNIIAEDGKEMKLDSEQLGIKGVMEELDRHSRILARQEELTGN